MRGVSIIIPAYRAEAYIARAVTSLINQKSQGFEMVIASDDGQDYVALLAEQNIQHPRIRCVYTGGVRTGLSHARNTALAAASGNIIVSLDADDALAPDYLEHMVTLAEQYGAAISQVSFIDHASGQALNNCFKPYPQGALKLEDLYLACVHTYASMVFDRNRIKHTWNEQIPLLEDAVFLAQCCDTLGGVWYSNTPLYQYFHRDGSLCNTADAAARFLEAGKIIRQQLQSGAITIANEHTRKVLSAYIAKNDAIEIAFETAVKAGEATDYQDFLNKNIAMLHKPLI
jgi:glycosyltransferase involved in cell wall biosynthesis